MLSVNLVGPFRCTRAAAPHLKAARGAVVNTASTAGYGYPGSSMAYAASKAALMNLTTNLARGLAPEVRVNAVAPGMIRTPWTIRFGQAWEDSSVAMTSLKRVGTPDDIAEVILFLLAGAGYVTGQTIRGRWHGLIGRFASPDRTVSARDILMSANHSVLVAAIERVHNALARWGQSFLAPSELRGHFYRPHWGPNSCATATTTSWISRRR